MSDAVPRIGRPFVSGAALMALAALIGVVLVFIAYFTPHGPIAHSWGTLLVLVSTALMLMAALLLALAAMPRWLVILFEVLIILDIAGTGVCAYFLEFHALLVLMVIALAGWIAHLVWDFPHRARS